MTEHKDRVLSVILMCLREDDAECMLTTAPAVRTYQEEENSKMSQTCSL